MYLRIYRLRGPLHVFHGLVGKKGGGGGGGEVWLFFKWIQPMNKTEKLFFPSSQTPGATVTKSLLGRLGNSVQRE